MATPGGKNLVRGGKGSQRRRSVVRVRDATLRQRLRDLVEQPNAVWAIFVAVGLVVFASVLGNWARVQPLVAVGQVMNETRTVRAAFTTVDEQETDRQREEARQRTPHLFAGDTGVLEDIRASLENLPRAISGAGSLDEIERDIRVKFGLSAENLVAIKAIAGDEAALGAWSGQVAALDGVLRRRPMLDRATFQSATQEGLSPQIALRIGDEVTYVSRVDAVNSADSERFEAEVATIVRIAGFRGQPAELVIRRLTTPARASFSFDSTATTEAQDEAGKRVDPVVLTVPVGQKIFDRGDVLDQAQFDLYARELGEYRTQRAQSGAGALHAWLGRFALSGAIGVLTLMLAIYIAFYGRDIWERAPRVAWLCVLVACALLVACVGAVGEPRYGVLVTLTPVVLVAALVTIAYSQRVALAVGGVTALLVGLMLGQSIASVTLALAGVGAAAALLGDLRERRSLVRMALVAGGVMAVSGLFAGLVDRPVTGVNAPVAWRQTIGDAVMAGAAGLIVGGVTLFMLPIVERLFGITTGMTLIELRDPKQPLLREMQQSAPGTYNHSLNVANISEQAAEAIGADGLLTYVGCLYHDIGKINKPEYFVENQGGGPNKHDKLSPAMSLLVIVGHVKDGLEMAREHGLPRSLQHFIEAHHGTTLVEYFYHRARKKAQGEGENGDADKPGREDERMPDEVDYRYPGPKPQTKEVAISMLADCVESATRTLSEPTASRIDALVRELANRRLMDGQFDECDLTLSEVKTICDSISKSVASIYHGRVKYASTSEKPKGEKAAPAKGDDEGGAAPKEGSA